MKLTVNNVSKTFKECLATNGKQIVVEGIVGTVAFNPEALEENKKNILEMIDWLPENCKKEKGGLSFLDLCIDKEGELWTGVHEEIEKLILLGLAVEKMEFMFPRNTWSALPGGMPYLLVV